MVFLEDLSIEKSWNKLDEPQLKTVIVKLIYAQVVGHNQVKGLVIPLSV